MHGVQPHHREIPGLTRTVLLVCATTEPRCRKWRMRWRAPRLPCTQFWSEVYKQKRSLRQEAVPAPEWRIQVLPRFERWGPSIAKRKCATTFKTTLKNLPARLEAVPALRTMTWEIVSVVRSMTAAIFTRFPTIPHPPIGTEISAR